jgi:hydrogenase/urease accessory protein HupE
MEFLTELWGFIRARRKFWMVPFLFVLILIGGLLIVAKGSAVAPFIYTVF